MRFVLTILLLPLINLAYCQKETPDEGKMLPETSPLKVAQGEKPWSSDSIRLGVIDSSRHMLEAVRTLQGGQTLKHLPSSQMTESLIKRQKERITQNLDSAEIHSRGVLQKNGALYPSLLFDSIDSTKHKFQERMDTFNNNIEAKTKVITDKLQKNLSGPAVNAEQSFSELAKPNLDGRLSPNNFDLNQKVLEKLEIDTSLPSLELPSNHELNIAPEKLDIGIRVEKLDAGMPDMDKLTEVRGQLNEMDQKLSEAQRYKEEINSIKESGINDAEKLPEEIESKAEELEEIKALNEETQKVAQYQDVIQQYKDQKLIKEEITRKARLVANDKLNKFSPALKSAQEQIAKAKKLNPAVQGFKDIIKKRPNEMKGKPFRQRFLSGITLQNFKNDKLTIDAALQAGYRISGRLTAGIGYTYRVSISKDNINWIANEGISGYRVYTDFRLIKTFYAHGEFEALTIDSFKQPQFSESRSNHVYGSYFGLGKRFEISRKIKGSVIGLYRVDYNGSIPRGSKITLRMGFDLNLKKEKKKYTVPRIPRSTRTE